MFFVYAVNTVDEFVSRVDHSSLSQQTLMELLIGKIPDSAQITLHPDDKASDAFKWINVKHDAAGRLTSIDWSLLMIEGTLDLQFLPSSIAEFDVSWNTFTGTLNLTRLPYSLRTLNCAMNNFTGQVDLTALPDLLQMLCISNNNLTGSIDLRHLPCGLEKLSINNNQLSADPMDGHLYVVGRTSTPSWGKPGATRCCWDPPWQYRVATGASTVYHCRGPLASVATKVYLWPPRSARMRAVRKFHSLSLLLRAGDVHPNPGPILRIAQQNILGLTPGKKVSLLHKANILNLDVILLQELRITEDEASRLAMPGFHCYSVARDAKGGGVAVLVRDALSSVLRAHSVSAAVEHITVCVKAGDEIAYFTSAYFPRANRVTPASILELSNDSWRAHIIGADSNAHHSMWDSYAHANAGGRHILDFSVAQAYNLVNDGCPTRRDLTIQKGKLSSPDVTLARGCIARGWKAKPDPDSDHFLISFDLVVGDEAPLGTQVPKRAHYSWGKADWQEFRRLVTADCQTFPRKGTPDQQAKFLSRSIAKATAKAVPKGVPPTTSSWSAALEDATRKCDTLLNCIDGATPSQRQQILAATQERKKLLDTHCRERWGKVCADMKPTHSTTWKTLQNVISARPTPTNLVVEGGREVPLKTAANHLVRFFKKKARRHPAAQVARKPPRPTSLLRAITEQELHDALRFTKCHRACGPDDVYNEALLQLPKLARTALLRTFNRSLSRGIVPRAWKSGTIVPFLKPGKPAGRVDSYRPVTLTSAIAKLMERILHGRLKHHATSVHQAGFRAGMSTTDVLLWLRTQVQPTSASKTSQTSAVFVDFSRAFDSVDHHLLLKRLQKYNVDPYLVRWILSFLTGRKVRVRLGSRHYSRTETFTCGVPQGTVLGPLLFNIFMEGLSEELNLSQAKHYFYADDLTIVAHGRGRESVLNESLDMLSHWSRTHFMDVNVSKTKACHFRSRRSAPVLRYRGTELESDDTPKLLGVTFNKHRGFGYHTKSMKAKTLRTLVRLSAVANTLLGASRDVVRCFYLALVSSYVCYACPVWFGIASLTDMATMDSIQARGARLACGLPATTNTYDSLLEANLPSAAEQVKFFTYKFFLLSSLRGGFQGDIVARCFPPSSDIGKLHTEITEAYGSVEPLADAPPLNHRIIVRPWTLEAVTKEMDDALKQRASSEAVAHRHPADYEIWTDGSYAKETSSVAGAALIFKQGKERFKTVSVGGTGRSSFRSESLALHAGLRRVIADKLAAHECTTRYALWHKDALSIAKAKIAAEASTQLEARQTHRRQVVGLQRTKTKHLTGVRLLDCLASQARTNWSPHWGDLHRILNPSVDKRCRFCSDPPATPPLQTNVDRRRKRGRTTDPVACPECSIVLTSRSTGVNHLISTHGYERKEALRLLQRAPPAPPRAPNAPQQCPYCTRMCPTVAGVNRHVVEAHRAAARVKRARPADQPATPSAPQRQQCHLCSFASGTKGGLTMHLRRTHDFDRRVPKNHRPSDCEESVEHLLFHCPRFAALRIKHGIRPPGDPTQWFERRVPEFLADAFNLLPDRESKEDHPPAGSSPPTAPPTTAHRAGPTLNAARSCLARATSSVTSFLRTLGRKARNMACAKDDKQPPKSEPSLHTRKKTAASPSFRCTPRPLKKRKSSDAHTARANVL
ncbi:Tcoingi protein [Perkinsela sp. CCAP 1560/4]|nr:Tcoingi protein [Perkinsela sp. CCAP 1560/4]|eukprot:KNH04906.1 Tcoingi protein [Perkinsela sp. CCAP 1560/4]